MSTETYKCFLSILLLLTIPRGFYAQNTDEFRAVNNEDGLSNAFVTTFYKDSIGFMWVGTDNGLNRFDGVSIQSYYFSDKSIAKNSITAIVEWNNHIVISTDLGLMELNKENNTLQFIHPEHIATKIIKYDYPQ